MSTVFRVGDRVVVNRNGCTVWSHQGNWGPDGSRGTVDGTWAGHPGTEDDHLIAVSFKQGHIDVASYSFHPSELQVVRRGRGNVVHPLPAAHQAPGAAAAGGEGQ